MVHSPVARLARDCLCDGSVIRVSNPAEARRAQRLGAVGVLCEFPAGRRSVGAFGEVLDAISILPMCWPDDRALLEQAHRERHGDEEPGGYFILTPHDDPAACADPRALACSYPPRPEAEFDGPSPVFVCCRTLEEACEHSGEVIGSVVLLFLPTDSEMAQIDAETSMVTLRLVRRPGLRVIGIVGVQGDYHWHARALKNALAERPDAPPVQVILARSRSNIDAVDALVLPGGWSNLQSRRMRWRGMDTRIRALYERRAPILGVCAGMILARSRDGAGCEDRIALGLLDATVANNVVHGRHEVRLAAGGREWRSFAKAPVVREHGPAVEVLATLADGTIVGAGQDRVRVFAYHDGIHKAFLDLCFTTWADERTE